MSSIFGNFQLYQCSNLPFYYFTILPKLLNSFIRIFILIFIFISSLFGIYSISNVSTYSFESKRIREIKVTVIRLHPAEEWEAVKIEVSNTLQLLSQPIFTPHLRCSINALQLLTDHLFPNCSYFSIKGLNIFRFSSVYS